MLVALRPCTIDSVLKLGNGGPDLFTPVARSLLLVSLLAVFINKQRKKETRGLRDMHKDTTVRLSK